MNILANAHAKALKKWWNGAFDFSPIRAAPPFIHLNQRIRAVGAVDRAHILQPFCDLLPGKICRF